MATWKVTTRCVETLSVPADRIQNLRSGWLLPRLRSTSQHRRCMHPFTGDFWISLIVGSILGLVATRIRLSNSPLQGRRWVVVLGSAAGGIVGAVVFLGLSLTTAVFDYSLEQPNDWELLGPALLIMLFLFVGFSLRRE